MSITVPLHFVRHQAPNIAGMLGAGLRSAVPIGRPAELETPTPPVQQRIRPVPASLIDAYAEWSGAPRQRYADTVPPHMFSYWGLGLVSRLAGQTPYNLLSVVNQGCRLTLRRPMPAGEAIEIRGRLADITDDGRRIRIVTQLDAGTASEPEAHSIEVIAAVPRRNPEPRQRDNEDTSEPVFETVGHWSADADDGINFALLTGDFNPLHTVKPLGRRTRYGSCILHGFGQLARTYEALLNAGLAIGGCDIRFVKPVILPTERLDVQVAPEPEADNSRALRVTAPDGTVHVAGRFQGPGAAGSE